MGLGHVGVKDGRARPHGHSPADQLDGPRRVAALVVHHSEEMEGVGVLGLALQEPMVSACGIGVPAGLVTFESGIQARIHGEVSLQRST